MLRRERRGVGGVLVVHVERGAEVAERHLRRVAGVQAFEGLHEHIEAVDAAARDLVLQVAALLERDLCEERLGEQFQRRRIDAVERSEVGQQRLRQHPACLLRLRGERVGDEQRHRVPRHTARHPLLGLQREADAAHRMGLVQDARELRIVMSLSGGIRRLSMDGREYARIHRLALRAVRQRHPQRRERGVGERHARAAPAIGRIVQHPPRRVHRRDVGREHRRSTTRDAEPRLAQRHDERRRVGRDPLALRRGDERGDLPAALHKRGQVRCRRRRRRRRRCIRRRQSAADDAAARLGRQILERRQRDHEGETVGERGVERERPRIDLRVVVGRGIGGRRRRVHRRPAVTQPLEREALHPLLVDDGEELVLHLRTAAADLVEEDALRVPQRRRRAQVAQPLALRHRETDEVVEGEQARVVVSVRESERRRQPLEQRALGAAVRADEQHR